ILLLAFRCIVAEIYLARFLNIEVKMDIILELSITIVFIVISWYLSVISALFIYLVVYMIYLMIKKNDIIDLWRNVKMLIKSK
ncbi:hypothetical protein P5837_29200, partial [Bacillus cereus]|nr:hypothetical protein [Bacillus cereus]